MDRVRRIQSTSPIAVGDLVVFRPAAPGSGVIEKRQPRRSTLSRAAAGQIPLEQVIAANVDQVLAIVAAAEPPPDFHLLDRMLVVAGASGIPAWACINKVDLVSADEANRCVKPYVAIGCPTLRTSALAGEGIEAFADALRGKVTALFGASGVGKSSLLNRLEPGLGLRVKEISRATGLGRHATTWVSMHRLELGGAVVDTPGVKRLVPWGVSREGLVELFPDLAAHAPDCRYRTCRHLEERGCAVREAVSTGNIAPTRYQSYRFVYYEIRENQQPLQSEREG